MGVRLPAEYQEVSFLQSTGTQYIALSDGGDIDGAECSFQYTEANNLDAIYGSSDNTSQNTKRFFSNIYNNSIQVSSGINETSIQFSTDLLQFHSLRAGVFCGNKAILDGTERDMLPAITRDYNMGVFCMCTNTGYGRQSKARIFALTFYVGNTIKYKLICCYRKSDSKPGMYDLVTKQFFINQGEGEFLVGPDVIDSISPWLVARRRALMRKEPELYPIGTDVVSMYAANWVDDSSWSNTGGTSGISGASRCTNYIPINPKYTYRKSTHRLYNYCCWYDKDKHFIRSFSYNNTTAQNIANIPENARYMRISTYIVSKENLKVIRTA